MNMIVKTYIYSIKLYAIKLYCKQNRFIEIVIVALKIAKSFHHTQVTFKIV